MLKLHPVEFDNAELTMSPIDLTWQEQGDPFIIIIFHSSVVYHDCWNVLKCTFNTYLD